MDQLSRVQESYRGIVRDLRSSDPDRDSVVSTIAASQDVDEDKLIAISTVLFELHADKENRVPQENDILWSQEFLDHLDTLGWELRRKQ